MYARTHKNLRANLFEISQSFDRLGVCTHVRCTHKKSYAPKNENSTLYACTHKNLGDTLYEICQSFD